MDKIINGKKAPLRQFIPKSATTGEVVSAFKKRQTEIQPILDYLKDK